MGGLNRDYRTVNDGVDIVADDADEIQPAIDEISESVVAGDISAGVVRLKPKAYYPETTIFLKRGVTLRGARATPKHVTGSPGADEQQSSTLYTSGLERGPEAYTWHHFDGKGDKDHFNDNDWDRADFEERSHPHYPVVAGFDRLPVERDRERTEYERFHRAHGVGLENLAIRADEERWWDYDEHGPAHYWHDPDRALYHGVFDGFIFEGLNEIHVQGVEVHGFRGYGGFYADTRHIVSRGNFYNGGWTDHHGSSLTLDFAALGSQARYVRGIWDVEVEGPTPALSLGGHGVRDAFVAGGWSRAKITGLSPAFIGDETTFDDGDHLLGPSPDDKNTTVVEPDSHTLMDGYCIEGNGEPESVGYRANDSNTRIVNTRVHNVDVAIDTVHQQDILGHNLHLIAEDVGIRATNFLGNWSNVTIEGATKGIDTWNRASPDQGFHNVHFKDVTYGFAGGSNQAITVDHPNFTGAETALESGFEGNIVISSPIGYSNAASGTATISGGGDTAYDVIADMDEVPVAVVATPTDDTAQAHWPVRWSAGRSGDDVQITFTLSEALPGGETASLSWAAVGWSHPHRNVQRRGREQRND